MILRIVPPKCDLPLNIVAHSRAFEQIRLSFPAQICILETEYVCAGNARGTAKGASASKNREKRKEDAVELMMIALLCRGHVLIEDVPGVGKTTLASALARSLDCSFKRIQFTPDITPSDITGFSIVNFKTGELEYRPGLVMSQIVLADEINRTSPKTQSSLLEVMEEGNVTVDGVTREVPRPFLVMATQNPIGSAGTQMLPESQLDRFMICMSMGYPDIENEIAIIKGRDTGNPIDEIQPVIEADELLAMQQEVEQVFIHDAIYSYIAKLVAGTREHPMLELGVSPRGTLALTRIAKAAAYLDGRGYVTPYDVAGVMKDVALHRIKLNSKARVNQVTGDAVLDIILEKIPKPTPKRR